MSYVKGPLLYTGNKYRLMPQIDVLLPNNVSTFVDLFGGGGTVSFNAKADKVIYNDILTPVVEMLKNLHQIDTDKLLESIDSIILEYNNLETKEDYLRLRADRNEDLDWLKLYILTCFSYNNGIRFNKKGGFNMTSGIGRNKYNPRTKENLIRFKEHIEDKNIVYSNKSFTDFDFSILTKDDFVYVDPPYLISLATYNEDSWSEESEKLLYELLDNLDSRGIRFAFSNVIEHKGKENHSLKEWSKKYTTHVLDMHYNNTWTATKKVDNRKQKTVEVLITNY